MKLYAIILFVVVLNFSFGFVGTMLPWFLPDAADELENNFQMSNPIKEALISFSDNSTASVEDDNWLMEMITTGMKGLKMFFTFIVSCITFLPDLIDNVLTQIYAGIDDTEDNNRGIISAIDILTSIMKWGLGVLLGISVIQLFTGKWLPFAE